MAQPTNALDLYEVGGSTLIGSGPLKEQLIDAVFNVDPDETPVASLLPRTEVRGPLVQWLRDTLPASSNIVTAVDGDQAPSGGSYLTNVTPLRLNNVTMNLRADVSVADDVLESDQAGYENALAYHIGKWSKTWGIRLEEILVDPTVAPNTPGSASSARVIKNIPYFQLDANSTFDTTFDLPAATGTDAMSEDDFNDAVQVLWQNGGKTKIAVVDMATLRNIQSAFLGLAKTVTTSADSGANRRQIEAMSSTIWANVEFYRSPAGMIAFLVNRRMTGTGANSRCYLLDRNFMAIGWHRPLKPVPLGKRGDSTEVMLIGTFTLLDYNEKAHMTISGTA